MRAPVDHSGRGPTRGALGRWGLAMIALVVAIAIPVTLYARGAFDHRMELTLISHKVADTLTAGADVKYRGLLIGRVDHIEVTPDGEQRMTVSLNAAQAGRIAGDLTARFMPSNIFGVAGIELQQTTAGSAGNAARLRDGTTITMNDDTASLSAISVLRDVGSITTTLTGTDVTEMINHLDTAVDQLAPLVASGFELLNLARAHQHMRFADVLRISADTLYGADRIAGPFVDLFTTLVEKTEMYADPVQTRNVTGALTGLVQTFITLGQVVGHNPRDLATVLDASLTLGAPLGYTLSTVPPAAADLQTLLDRLERTLPVVGGKPRLRLGIGLAALPQITAVLRADAGGGR